MRPCNDLELDPNREPEPPTKVMDKPVQRAGKRNAGPEAPAAAEAPRPAGRGGRNAAFTGSEQAFRDRGAGAQNNRAKPTDDGVRQDRHPRNAGEGGNRGRGPRGGRGGARGPRTGRDDKHDRTGHAGSNDHAKQAGAAWGHETGNAELNDEKAALADAKAEEAKEGIVSDVTAVDAEGVAAQETPAEEDNVKSYEQYLAEQLEKKAALASTFEARKANEGASKKFPEGKAFERDANENYVAPSAGKAKKQKERKDKNLLDIDQAWKEEQSQSQDSGFRGGRGGARGGSDRPRGGPRGGRGGPRGGAPRGGAPRDSAPRAARSSAAAVNVGSSSDFPSLGA
ncbi:hypothetical protein E4T50_07509 [Aureobasidium sp. EXF-12298]|nr:hypothetical protein E4T50_07509 [Aureobasidium sp. EXF-12298]